MASPDQRQPLVSNMPFPIRPSILPMLLSLMGLALPATAWMAITTNLTGTPEVELPTVAVTSPPILEVSLDRYSSKITTLSTEQIVEMNAADLSSALRHVPGVTVSRYGLVGSFGGDDGGAFFIRGHGSGRPGAQIVTMVDGIPRFVGVWTHPILDMMPIDAAGRLEINKSPQPVLGGNMSFGSVNLVSKIATEAAGQAEVAASYGSFDTYAASAQGGQRTDDYDVYGLVSTRRSNGHRPNADGSTTALYARAGLAVEKHWPVSLVVHHDRGWAHDPEPVGVKLPIVERFETNDTLSILTLENRYEATSGFVKLFIEDGSLDWRQWTGAPPAKKPQQLNTLTDYLNYGLRARQVFQAFAGNEVLAGFDADWYGGEVEDLYAAQGSIDTPRTTFRNLAPYAMVSQTFGESVPVTASAGVRYTESRDFSAVWAGQAGLKAQAGGQTFFANYARGFNYAGVYSKIFAQRWGAASYTGLNPELVDHYEIGWTGRLTDRLSIETSFFHDEVRDALRFSPPPAKPPTILNIAQYRQNGAEASLQALPLDNLRLFLGGAWLDPNRADIPNAPAWSASAGLAWELAKQWRFNLDYQFVDDQVTLNSRFGSPIKTVEAYHLVDARVAWIWRPANWVQELEISLSADNLLDENYELRPGYPMPGTVWTLGLRTKF